MESKQTKPRTSELFFSAVTESVWKRLDTGSKQAVFGRILI